MRTFTLTVFEVAGKTTIQATLSPTYDALSPLRTVYQLHMEAEGALLPPTTDPNHRLLLEFLSAAELMIRGELDCEHGKYMFCKMKHCGTKTQEMAERVDPT